MRVLGFMTGTSLDAVDMAVLETDGETITAFGPAGERKLSEDVRALLLDATDQARAWKRDTPAPAIFGPAAAAVAREHFEAADQFLADNDLTWSDLDLVGMHGQTVVHERPTAERVGRTVQLGDAQALADRCGVPVAFDFRTADVAAGGEGAPLAPIYHRARALASGLTLPVAVLNIGGVANVTLIGGDDDLLAFDTGPGNGMIDLLLQAHDAGRYDEGGRLAASGWVDEDALQTLFDHPYFAAPPPKSLDRYDFALDAVADLSLPDAAATLVAFTARTVALGVAQAKERPTALIVCGGGRHNPQIMKAMADIVPCPVKTAEDYGWRGDSIEAEAFAYLAARTAAGLPISFPGTTGVKTPMVGGRIVSPAT